MFQEMRHEDARGVRSERRGDELRGSMRQQVHGGAGKGTNSPACSFSMLIIVDLYQVYIVIEVEFHRFSGASRLPTLFVDSHSTKFPEKRPQECHTPSCRRATPCVTFGNHQGGGAVTHRVPWPFGPDLQKMPLCVCPKNAVASTPGCGTLRSTGRCHAEERSVSDKSALVHDAPSP